MKYCKECLTTNLRPNSSFNNDSVCIACEYANADGKSFESNLNTLKSMIQKNKSKRKKHQKYDCIVGVSGGKDSTRQAHWVRDRLGLNPLLVCCGYPPLQMTDIGAENMSNLISMGFDVEIITPAPQSSAQLSLSSFRQFGNVCKSTEMALYSAVPRVAILKKIPLVLLNGRITKKTFLRWSKIPKTANKVFQSFDLCLPSSKISKNYLKKLNVKKIKYYGNLKLTSNENLKIYNFRNKKFLKQNNFWSAVSIHEEEILFCLKTHINVKKVIKTIVTIIIPRHIGKVKKIKSVCEKLNLNYQILSDGDIIKSNKEIIIINAYGIMANYLKVCKSVFIGKSMPKILKEVGGQNPIEAAKLGCKVYHGPYVNNFKEIYELLLKFENRG